MLNVPIVNVMDDTIGLAQFVMVTEKLLAMNVVVMEK